MKFGKYFKICPTRVRLQHFSSWCERWRILRRGGIHNHFAAVKWVYKAAKWHSCAKGWFRSCETPFKMAIRLRNGGSQGVESSQPFRGCERVYLATKWHSCAMGSLRSCENFHRGGWATAKPFHSGKPFSQRLTFAAKFRSPCSLLVFWAPLDSQLPSFTSFDIPPDFDHPKTYVTSKQIKIKALKTKLKQVKKTKQKDMD